MGSGAEFLTRRLQVQVLPNARKCRNVISIVAPVRGAVTRVSEAW